eukprot:TRINITY_DN6943_c1_g3_i2.p1 TRINITY_DN6943_c1_g3~~TRINITY_DN6943_c1_g3_i2.p1  ORF type:complete len:176 (-),score=27.89 TRINITY_DN6943_c1_g3_i2:640-1167(-)
MENASESKVFGVPLEELYLNTAQLIPAPLERGITWLNDKALDEEGLYRVPGDKTKVCHYIEMFDSGKEVNFYHLDERLPENVTSVVTSFVKRLPHSLLTNELHNQFSQVLEGEGSAQTNDKLKFLISALPPTNREILHLLATHFNLVLSHSNKNLMSLVPLETTLSIIWGRTLSK